MSEVLRTFYQNFAIPFWFVYGLVFYSLGLAILLQSRHFSRLTLAKSLPWFGAFGIVHASFEWGYFMSPIFLEIVGQQYYTVMVLIQQVLIAVAFFLLFQFGIELFRPFKPHLRWIRLVPTIIFFCWLIGPYVLGFTFIPKIEDWIPFAEACARYFICVPGSIVAVSGLIHQQRLQIKPLKLPIIDNVIRAAAGTLSTFGVLSGLIVPKSFFFPTTIVNYQTFEKVMLAPPFVYRSITGVLLFVLIIRALEVFDLETNDLIRKMEEVQVVANERERIARDLHDGALQQVYASGLLAQSLKKHVSANQQQEVNQLVVTINQAISQLREFLPHEKHEFTTVDLIGALTPKIDEARHYIHIDTFWSENKLPSLSIDQTRHVAALLSEAISNAIRHAKSETMAVSIDYHDNHLILEVQDFGKGISSSTEQGFGLQNMRDRARLLGAEFSIHSELTKGTVVRLDMPVKEEIDEH